MQTVSSAILFLLSAVITAVLWLSQRVRARRVRQQQEALLAEIAELRREAARLNTPSTFSKHALLQRRVNAKEKELVALHSRPQDPRLWNRQDQVILGARVLQVALMLLACLLWWRTPVAELPPGYAWPLGFLLTAPHGKVSYSSTFVGAMPWLALSVTATCAVLQAASDLQSMLSQLMAGAHSREACQQHQVSSKDKAHVS